MEICYEIEIEDIDIESSRIAAIDIGVDNLVTLTNNIGKSPLIINGKILKSINQQYNKQKAKLQSDLMKRNGQSWSKRLDELTAKRYFRIKNYMHNTSAKVIQWCVENNINTLIVGKNDTWKQAKKHMQNFTAIPYEMLLEQLKYKCENVGIKYMEINEAYTSGTSYLDDEIPIKENYNRDRRVERGLFQAKDTLINSDVNGSLQIMRKAFPDSYTGYGIEVDLTPIIINAV
jgi:putative transposase